MKILSALAAAVAAAAVLVLVLLPSAGADVNLNNLDCQGHIAKGEPEKDEVDDTNVGYTFACNGPITGYSILSSKEVQGYETEVFGIDAKTGAPYPNDSFSCTGDLPGYGLNCNGFAGFLNNADLTYDPSQKTYVTIKGNFSIDGALCDEPRTDVVLTVMTATKNASGGIVQAISGPYGLGRPRGCKPSKFSGKTRVPKPDRAQNGDDVDLG